jgi:hypothetical protein
MGSGPSSVFQANSGRGGFLRTSWEIVSLNQTKATNA